MTKDVKEALNTCGRNMALITEENCPEILYLAREEILQEIIMGMMKCFRNSLEETIKSGPPRKYLMMLHVQ